ASHRLGAGQGALAADPLGAPARVPAAGIHAAFEGVKPMRSSIDHVTARDLLMARESPVGTEQVALSLSAGRVLAKDLIAAENIPPFDRSPYDGYAFRAADTEDASREHPVELTVLEEVAAGAVPTRPATPGMACKILTGA